MWGETLDFHASVASFSREKLAGCPAFPLSPNLPPSGSPMHDVPQIFVTAARYSHVTLSRHDQFEGVIAAAKTGAEWAITVLYREFGPGLLRYLRAQAPADGEDLASEVWMNAAAGLGRFEGDEAAFRCWLFSIARRRLIDFRRREQRRRAMLSSLETTGASHAVDREARALMASESEAALAHIATLPPDQAEVVLLRVVAGLNVEEVAAIVGKKAGAVRVMQHRALKRLSGRLVRERREADVTEWTPGAILIVRCIPYHST